jgi:hypothetical protein
MYSDIRPYRDDEVASVIQNLVNDPEFQASVAAFIMPKLNKVIPRLCRWMIKLSLQRKTKSFTKVNDLQLEAAKYLYRLIKRSTDGFTYTGLDKLDNSKPMLFISNHRDITLDPALINLALHESGYSTLEIAIGDNLLSKPWISDLMRLNKSFIVKRSEKTKRAMLTASKKLSSYVHHTLNDNQQNVWIAQKEGRAKDGLDVTNSALISMLLLNKDKKMPISEYLQQLNIVPVSISYEYDPCDTDKAIELAEVEANGNYEKAEHEDIRSITQGIVGHKGQVNVAFGEVIQGDFADSKAIAAAIDQQIIGNYHLFESNQSAYQVLHQQGQAIPQLNERLQGLTQAQQRWLLTMYANAVVSQKGMTETNE